MVGVAVGRLGELKPQRPGQVGRHEIQRQMLAVVVPPHFRRNLLLKVGVDRVLDVLNDRRVDLVAGIAFLGRWRVDGGEKDERSFAIPDLRPRSVNVRSKADDIPALSLSGWNPLDMLAQSGFFLLS